MQYDSRLCNQFFNGHFMQKGSDKRLKPLAHISFINQYNSPPEVLLRQGPDAGVQWLVRVNLVKLVRLHVLKQLDQRLLPVPHLHPL